MVSPQILVIGLLLATAPIETAPQPSLDVSLQNQLGGTFAAVEVTTSLDGKPLFERSASEGPIASGRVFEGPVPSGVQAMDVHLVVEGRSPVFGYVNGYRFHMRARATLDLRAGRGVSVTLKATERNGVTVPWEDRPTFDWTITPKEAVLDMTTLPTEKQPIPAPVEQAQPDIDPASQARADAKAEALTKEVLKQADELAPRRPPKPAEPQGPPQCRLPTVHFGFARFTLGPAVRKALRSAATCIAKASPSRIRIVGHCDARGSTAYNQTLGQWRADSVSRFLISQGVATEQVEAISQGKEQPLCQVNTEACYARNRRVGFEWIP